MMPNHIDMRTVKSYDIGLKKILSTILLLFVSGNAISASYVLQKSPPVSVVFGIRTLTPDTPINAKIPFVSQHVVLPNVTCPSCEVQDEWTQEWTLSSANLDPDKTNLESGWYVFKSGLQGIEISVNVPFSMRNMTQGKGNILNAEKELIVGLLRTDLKTGAGLVSLPDTDFIRTTTYRNTNGVVKYIQKDTLRVTADLRVPTCTTSANSLHFQLPDISQNWLKQNIGEGEYANEFASLPQVILANCSENTRNLRIRFIPSGTVTNSSLGASTILVGRDDNGQDTGVGFLLKYESSAFGQKHQGVVHWDWAQPLEIENPSPTDSGNALIEGISIRLYAFYARPLNEHIPSAGQITAKGMYQVSYD